jgi:3D (Asp-Asp-Asp) domain-containing protein
MTQNRTLDTSARRRERVRTVFQGIGLGLLLVAVGASAILVKDAQTSSPGLPLAAIDDPQTPPESSFDPSYMPLPVSDPLVESQLTGDELTAAEPAAANEYPADTRWFDGRPMRPSRTILMTVTGYSPGEESCAGSADGITSSLHSVWTNGMKLVAADTRVLPLGTIVSVPGYHGSQLVPVLDRGGKIKGNRLDLLYPTAEQARTWGVKKIRITVWEYVDGEGAPDWRKIRDSKN